MQSKKINITGTSTGFGNITARRVAENGHTVYAATWNKKNIKNKF